MQFNVPMMRTGKYFMFLLFIPLFIQEKFLATKSVGYTLYSIRVHVHG